MKHIAILIAAALISLACKAQTVTDRYELTPDYMQEVFSDIIGSECNIICLGDATGQYTMPSSTSLSTIACERCSLRVWLEAGFPVLSV